LALFFNEFACLDSQQKTVVIFGLNIVCNSLNACNEIAVPLLIEGTTYGLSLFGMLYFVFCDYDPYHAMFLCFIFPNIFLLKKGKYHR
jgi:hypothetical protein